MVPTVSSKTLNPPESPFTKGGTDISSLWKREVACLREAASAKAGEGFIEMISKALNCYEYRNYGFYEPFVP